MDGAAVSEHKAHSLLAHGIGHITRLGGASNLEPQEAAHLANEIQRFLKNNTRLGIPALIHEEACSGYMARGATVFPQAIGVASAWNVELTARMARVIGEQIRAVGGHQALAPLLDITRDPRWGRMEETFGEDPVLVAQLGMAYIRGLQGNDWDHGVIATGKHFVGYGLSEGGLNWAPPHISERELREMVLWPFEAAVREAGLESVMPGYHELDGVPMHAHRALLRSLLRTDWQFLGTTVSDYFAIAMLQDYHHVASSRQEAARMARTSGVDMELPNRDAYGPLLVDAVRSGDVSLALVDEAVARILRHKWRLGLFRHVEVDPAQVPFVFSRPENTNTALQIARESIVLIKNDQHVLPLKRSGLRIAVVGPNADEPRHLMGDYAYPCHIETLIQLREGENVFGQPLPDSVSLDNVMAGTATICEAIQQLAGDDAEVVYVPGCGVNSEDRTGFPDAVKAAAGADVVVLVVGDKSGLTLDCTAGESRDRADLRLPGVQGGEVQMHPQSQSVTRPVKQLAAFAKIGLDPGQSREVQFRVPLALLAHYTDSGEWALDPGGVEIMIGAASEDIRATHAVLVPALVRWASFRQFSAEVDC